MYDFKIKDEPFAVGYIQTEGDIYTKTGAGILELAKNVGISFDGETGFPNFDVWGFACRSTWQEGQVPKLDLLEKKAAENPELAEDYRYIASKMKVLADNAISSQFSEHERDINESASGWGGTWGGHAVPNLVDFARIGTSGIREKVLAAKAKNGGKDGFYAGLLNTLDAIELLCGRIFEAAKAEYAKTGNGKLLKVISTFENCPVMPAKTFAEAVCVYQMIFNFDGVDSPGHFDQYMFDFWKVSDYAESREALEDLWRFFHKTRTWNLCISGSDENWNDLSNDLTYEILDVARKFRFQTPNITMRCHRNTPERLYSEAAKTIATGIGMPALYNDEVVCAGLESLGIPAEDAHRYVMNGCNQIDIQGKSHMGLEDGEVNFGLALRYAICNGRNSLCSKEIGAKTGEPETLDTFEKFYSAVKAQLAWLADGVCSAANRAQRLAAEYSSNPIRSMTLEGCIEKGRDYKNRGPLYGHGQILTEGGAELFDSVANIKKFVYEDKKYTLSEVRDAIEADFEGWEEMLSDFKNSGLNFGNDIPCVDEIAKDIMDFFNTYLRTKETWRGGKYSGGCSPFNRAADYGRKTGAYQSSGLCGYRRIERRVQVCDCVGL
ncbi:MAG: pyruvate formate lyase family protein [Oscillospiraceae bacterium]|nr:pyruvate formate lyase family protein [Oscillospiraceae bacterium]